MSSNDWSPVADCTEDEAQQIHDLAMATDPDHDTCPCWCCCRSCDFDVRAVLERSR